MTITRARAVLLLAMLSNSTLAGMTLSSTDLAPGHAIPSAQIYPRCGGQNISPQLSWSGAPTATKSYVLTMIDIDVKPWQWSHWIVVQLPPEVHVLARGVTDLPGEAQAIVSNFGDAAYAGPCPPKGTGKHHYEFTLWAMPTFAVSVRQDEPATEVTAELAQHALDRVSLTAWVQAPGTGAP
jgi:Raf kinase inhibitor-like YbhB/YbcL family protein